MTIVRERICVEGDPNQIDSFAACLAAVLNAWGSPVSYNWVAGLGGTAFSPVLDEGEDCMAWWMEAGSDARVGFLGRALGFSVERVTREEVWDDPARAVYAETGLLPEPHELHFARLRAAFDRGDGVLLRTWPAWSLLDGWDRDLDQLPFATLPGFEDLVARIWGPSQAQLVYLLYPVCPSLSLERSLEIAIRFGARVARGRGPNPNLRYGPALYRAAASRMDTSVFCTTCGDHGDSCAHRTLMRMLGTQRSAIGFLEEAQAVTEGALPWESAIVAFEAMAAVTADYCGWQAFQEAWPDAEFRDTVREDLSRLATLQLEAGRAMAGLAAAYERELAL